MPSALQCGFGLRGTIPSKAVENLTVEVALLGSGFAGGDTLLHYA